MRSPESKNHRSFRTIAVSTLAAVGLIGIAGCGEAAPPTPHDKATDCLQDNVDDNRNLVHELKVPGQNFIIKATYSTDYDVASWKITDTKTLDIKMEVEPVDGAKGPLPQIEIENLHADASIKANKAGLNGLTQDSFDDHLHTGDQAGFEVSVNYPYTERFVIDGYSDTLLSGWGFISGGTGYEDFSEQRLTEKNLLADGVYGEEITFVTDLLMKNEGDKGFHKAIVGDSFIVPVAGKAC